MICLYCKCLSSLWFIALRTSVHMENDMIKNPNKGEATKWLLKLHGYFHKDKIQPVASVGLRVMMLSLISLTIVSIYIQTCVNGYLHKDKVQPVASVDLRVMMLSLISLTVGSIYIQTCVNGYLHKDKVQPVASVDLRVMMLSLISLTIGSIYIQTCVNESQFVEVS